MTKLVPKTSLRLATVALFALVFSAQTARADLITITNAGFEDTSGQTVFNEFTFGTPAGWSLYDPNSIEPDPGTFVGTLQPNGTDFFNSTAPEGNRVAILFNSGREGEGEYGFEQTLAATLQANTDYSLSVEVGNIASGFAQNGTFFNLDEFPGYRVELLAGGVVIAQDNNSLTIAEGEFATSTVNFSVGGAHAQLGQTLGIRLVNLNVIPAGFTQGTSPDLEVDFDNVTLNATSVPEPATLWLMSFGGACLMITRRRRRQRLVV
ncbi:MAG: PEP-CTERM sorting domain-containing protein [Planctomycetaceae bacterium]